MPVAISNQQGLQDNLSEAGQLLYDIVPPGEIENEIDKTLNLSKLN